MKLVMDALLSDLSPEERQAALQFIVNHKDPFSKHEYDLRRVLSFGLVNAPSHFQRIVDFVLAGLSWESCLVCVDDIIVMSSTFCQHTECLGRVFHRLEEADLKLRPDKCHIFQRRVTFLGLVVSQNGIEPDPCNVSAIVELPVPANLNELRSRFGLASYFRPL